jgi:hypothetical protein
MLHSSASLLTFCMGEVCAIPEGESPLEPLNKLSQGSTQQRHLYPLQAALLVPVHHLS